MSATELLRMLRAQPFAPFRVHISGGTIYEIRHPDRVIVLAAAVIVAFPDPSHPEMASGWEMVALRYMIRLEPLLSQAGLAN